MKKISLFVIFFLASSFFAFGQTQIESFDNTATDPTYHTIVEGVPSYIELSQSDDHQEGAASTKFKAYIGSFNSWGSYAQFQKRVPEGESLLDWTVNDSLSLWIKIVSPPAHPENVVFRIQIADQPTSTDNVEEFVYESATMIDAASDWINLRIPLKEITSDGSINPGDSGFVIMPTSWNNPRNNSLLDFDKIVGYSFVFVTTTATDDSVTILYDGFDRFGYKAVSAIMFNGSFFPNQCVPYVWGQSAVEVVEGAGIGAEGPNAIKWTMGDEWGTGWTGMGVNVSPAFNLAGAWPTDSVKFWLKAEEGVDTLRAQFEDGTGKVGSKFVPIADNQWHFYSLPLRDMVFQDNTTSFDSSHVTAVGIMANATAIAGKVVYITNWWTGNPIFDVIAPTAPQSVAATQGPNSNVITWSDVAGENGETYNVYYSKNPITDVHAAGVDCAKLKLVENTQVADHLLLAPGTNQDVTYYYAVTATDNAGNESLPGVSSAITNTARGVAVINTTAPSNFTADGDLTEWAGITPTNVAISTGTGFVAPNTVVDNDADLSFKAYLAMDQENIYIAYDVEDDIISFVPTLDSYLNDCPDLFIGLYNAHGMPHTGMKRGSEPDYHLRFAKNRMLFDGIGNSDTLYLPGTANYAWQEKFPTGYIVEAKIPFSLFAEKGNDNLFVPVEGYRIPVDFEGNDADATGTREGILCYSPYNQDKSYQDVTRWLNTWIGNMWDPNAVADNNNTVNNYNLLQNYPNPFNPSTKITYSIEKAGNVSLKVYDILGRVVTTLVDQYQNPGSFVVNFNASHLASGIYFYRIESGSFQSIKKMMLVK